MHEKEPLECDARFRNIPMMFECVANRKLTTGETTLPTRPYT